MIRRLGTLGVTLLVALPFAGLVSGPASAAKSVSVQLTTQTPNIDVGAQATFVYSTTGTGSGDTAQLQKQSGSTWQVVATGSTPATNRTIHAPAVSKLGQYTYRMQVVDSSDHVLATTPHNHPVRDYGDVTVRTICPNTTNAVPPVSRACAKNDTRVGSTTVETRMAVAAAVFPNYAGGARMNNSSCRAVNLTFTNPHNSTAETRLEVFQGSVKHSATAGRSKVGHLVASGYGGSQPMFINGSTESGPYSVYVAGTFSCWTATGTT